ARERRAAQLAAGELRRVFRAGEAELPEQVARLVAIVGRPEPGLDVGQRCRVAAEVRFLRQIADRGARLREAGAVVWLDRAGGDAQQGRLARAVASDQADALAGRDAELGAFEQRRAAKGEGDVGELDERRGHGASFIASIGTRWQ